MGKVCSALRSCLDRCFRNQEDEYKKRVLQLEERMLNRQSDHRQSKTNDIFSPRSSSTLRKSNIQFTHKLLQFQSPKSKGQRQPNNQIRQSTTSVDSYFTIGSGSATSHAVSRRTFKSINRKKSTVGNSQLLNSTVNQYKQFKQLTNQNNFQAPDLKLSRVQSQFNNLSQAMFEWNEKQYQRINRNINFQITTTQQLKLSSNIMINEAVNKLQDYYTFYFNQINNQFIKSGKQQQQQLQHYSGYYFRKYPQYKCSYSSQNDNLNSSQTFMMLMTFQSNTSNAIQFLQWYNSIAVQSKLYNFQKYKIIENGTYPIFQIQQFSTDIKQKYTYITVRQIENVKFDNQPGTQYILQLDSTFRKGNHFKSLIRFSDSDNGMVQIYCECTQKIKCPTQKYFMKIWKNLQALIKERLVKISVSRVIK